MESLIDTFHIDLKLLIAQFINFAIVFAVLYFFALKPLVKVMQERTKKIEKSVDDAKKIEEKLERSEKDYDKKLAEAKKEANAIMEKTHIQAEKKRNEMIAKAKSDIGQIIILSFSHRVNASFIALFRSVSSEAIRFRILESTWISIAIFLCSLSDIA